MFKPKVTKVTIEQDGESHDFWVRQAGAKGMLRLAELNRKKVERTTEQQQAETFSLLCHEDGSPLTKDELDALAEISFPALKKLNKAINDNAGIADETEGGTKNG